MADYKRLGDYIREVNVRNRDLEVTNLLGVNLSKQFFPSIANIIGTDLSKYKIIRKGQFGCKFMSVGRDGILPISLMTDEMPAIISSAYYVFEVKDVKTLMPEYLMMWLSRPEFDRQLWFYSGGDVRGGVDYDDFCEMPIVIPSIDCQREIVAEYETLTRRIRLNEQMIQKLEATAQALYHKMFVDGIDKDNLPEGWRMGTLGEVATFRYGKIVDKQTQSIEFSYPVFSGYAITGYTNEYTLNEPTIVIIARGDAGTGKICMSPEKCFLSNLAIAIETKDTEIKNYLYYHLLSSDTMSLRSGSAQAQITINNIEPFEIMIPNKDICIDFSKKIEIIHQNIHLYKKENEELIELQSLLLVKMGQ